MLNEEMQQAVMDAVCHTERMRLEIAREESWVRQRPSVLFRPSLSIDGNMWCALYGENLQQGVAGFGYSPEDAMADFDATWSVKLPPRKADHE